MRICHLHNPTRSRSVLGVFCEQSYPLVSSRRFRTSPVCPDSNAAAPQVNNDQPQSRSQQKRFAMRELQDLFHRSGVVQGKEIVRKDSADKRSAERGSVRRIQSRDPTQTPSRGAAVDARSLGATPPSENVQRFTITRQLTESRGPKFRPRMPPSSGTPSTAKASQSSRQRSGRKGEQGNRRKTVSGRAANQAQEKIYRAMMETYELEKQNANAPQPVVFDPAAAERTDLAEFGPAISSGESGMRDVLAQKQKEVELYLRNKNYINRYQIFESARAKGHLLSVTDGLDTAGDNNANVSVSKTSIDDGPSPKSAEILNTLFSGTYISTRPDFRGQQQDVTSLVGRQAARNASYEEGDETSLVARVSRITTPAPRRQSQAKASNRQ